MEADTMKFKMIAGVNELSKNIESNNFIINELEFSEEKLICVLKAVLPYAMEDINDPDMRGKSPDKYILNLTANKLGDFSQRIILTCEEDGSIVGILIALPSHDMKSYNIFTIGVYKGFRGKGIGKALLHELTGILISKNVDKVTLDVHSHNIGAIRLYKNVGFISYDDEMVLKL